MEGMIMFSIICLITTPTWASPRENESKAYIVHMAKSHMPTVFPTPHHWYHSTLSSIKTHQEDEPFLYVYDGAMHGFSAKLTESEVDALQAVPGHLATYPDTSGKWHTTRSSEFLGLSPKSGIWAPSEFGNKSDVVIGILDSGIWPESKSFSDEGMGPVPADWKGQCQAGEAFNSSLCNRKLVGARFFNKGYLAAYKKLDPAEDYESARDHYGHGTHVSSIAAGNSVQDVDFFGYAKGTARGMAPGARVAMYKVGWFKGIIASDILAGMDAAIADGVDILSISLSVAEGYNIYWTDAISIAALAAVESGIFVSCSAGNGGALSNGAPWITTVGAATIDRTFSAEVELGHQGSVLQGTSLSVNSPLISDAPLVLAKGKCQNGSLDPKAVKGKVLVCNEISKYIDEQLTEAERTGTAAVIAASERPFVLDVENYILPAVLVNSKQAELIAKYTQTEAHPTVKIRFGDTEIGSEAPVVAYFSAQGPAYSNPAYLEGGLGSPSIVKPDIVAPGVDILGADVPTSISLQSNYSLKSGTSMSSPHAAGVAALVKAVHPEWSPAAIRSALMTTASQVDNKGENITDQDSSAPATALVLGAGHLNPNQAADPGLVYDLDAEDYLNYLCALNYTSKQILLTSRRNYSCPPSVSTDDLNYPSFLAQFIWKGNQSKTFRRTLTNVREDGRRYVYKAVVKAPGWVTVRVVPDTLLFNETQQKLEFSLTMDFGLEEAKAGEKTYGYLSWSDESNHVVRSPLVVMFENPVLLPSPPGEA